VVRGHQVCDFDLVSCWIVELRYLLELGVFILYELSPITASFKETPRSFLHFLINMMAILGGIFTVASLVDSLLYGSLQRLEKKVELGKFM
jgi:hypothetical protein